ncbi:MULTISPECIES: hypothetical protein [Streptomyces]|uniref:Alpha-ketoglutarate permease n=1 Tax=Streptomyces doudnae TaxID=3075536 RepID=A0ABD5EFY1_9ACTN|nr:MULTISPECIES: hypothetical protein [unclassified Streptomyces]MDT0433287.1 hypothetical protein [Streptomyces sp. DSM 41981]MYQ69231.1 hypothetical protein [Streptomyces sp. SID4950]SCE52346.1 hypothetical protein GA0115242_14644 [Streptomyces sp. SolWspMP-5a-2]
MNKNRVIGYATAAILALGLTAGAATSAGAFSGAGDGSEGFKPTKQSTRQTTSEKDGDKPEGISVQRTENGLDIRKLTEEELSNMDGAKPTKPLAPESATGEGNSDK